MVSPKFKLLWIAENALSWCIGMALGFTLEDTLMRELYFANENLWSIIDLISNIISACILGMCIGMGQAILLRRVHPINGWQWGKATFIGFVGATLLANIFGLRIFQQMDCFICFGGILMPPEFLWNFGIWGTYVVSRHTIGGPGLIGLGVGFSQWYSLKKQNKFSRQWILWSIVGYIVAFLGGIVVSIFFSDVLIVGVTTGALFGLITVLPLSSQLKRSMEVSSTITDS